MSLYSDPYSLIETTLIVAACPCEGAGQHDGRYGIAYLLMISQTPKKIYADYPDKPTRDAAFAAMRAQACLDDKEDEADETAE